MDVGIPVWRSSSPLAYAHVDGLYADGDSVCVG